MPEEQSNLNKESFKRKLPEFQGLKEKVLEKEVELKNEAPETKEKIIRKEIREKLQELQSIAPPDVPLAARDEAKEISKFSPERQVEALVSLVFEKGLEEAVSVAKRTNPAILDEFHKKLTDEYYEMLVNQGVIKIQ